MNAFECWARSQRLDERGEAYAAARLAWDAALCAAQEALPERAGATPAVRIVLEAHNAVSGLHSWAAAPAPTPA